MTRFQIALLLALLGSLAGLLLKSVLVSVFVAALFVVGFALGITFSRSDIDMAKGALIALHGCEPGEAFARLVDESQRRNIKVRDVAVELLARLKSSL